MVDEFLVGIITSTHGIRGLVKVRPTTDDPLRLAQGGTVTARRKGMEPLMLNVTQARMHKGMVLLGFEGYEDINLVEPLKGAELYVDRAHAAPLQDNEYYYADLAGMDVFSLTDQGEELLGRLTEVMETGANEVFVVRDDKGREILIPSIRECIREVDVEHAVMKVRLLPGMEMR